ncbi:MAG: choice-of-anchor D domain-containing protein [Terriglobales bacterium]
MTPIINGAAISVSGGANHRLGAIPHAANPSRQMLAFIALGASGNPTAISLSSATLSFSSEAVGSASASQTVTITNTGATNALTTLTVTSTPDFPITTTCGATLAAGANCTVSVAFNPTASGARTGAVTINAIGGGSSSLQAQVGLSGQATGGVLTVTPSSLDFGSRPTATTSAAQSVTLTNTGSATLNLTNIALSGSDFNLASSTCGTLPAALATGASCTLGVTYSPAQPGSSTGLLAVTSDSGNAVVALTGAANDEGLVLSSTSLDFGSQGLGLTGTKTISLTNPGQSAVSISAIQANGGFAASNNCGASLAAGATCTVTDASGTVGSNHGAIVVSDAGGAQQASLTGVATNYAVGAASGSATSATQGSGGGSATFALSYTPGTFTGTVSIGCSGDPAFATCTVNPASLALTAEGPASTVQVTVTTTGRAAVPPVAPPTNWPRLPLLWMVAALALFLAGLAAALRFAPASKRRQAVLGAVIWGAVLAAGCGGVASLPSAGNGTPAGTYVIVVTSHVGAATQVTNFTLKVD